MVEWLKKHWKLITVFAVGIPVLYWLYKTYQANSTVSVDQAATDPNIQDNSYSQGYALASIGGGGGPVSSTQATTSSPAQSTPQSSNTAQITAAQSANGITPGETMDEAIAASYAGYAASNNASQAIATPTTAPQSYPIYTGPPAPAPPPTTVSSMLFGSGGGSNDTAPTPVMGQAPNPPAADPGGIYTGVIPTPGTGYVPSVPVPINTGQLSHISDGGISDHHELAKTPTNVEMSSLGGR